MTRDDVRRFFALEIDFSALGLSPWGADDTGYFCTPSGAECFARTGVDGVHYCLLPGDETVYVVRPCGGEEGRCVLPVGETFRAFLGYLLFCGGEGPLEQLAWMDEAQFRTCVAEDMQAERESPAWGSARRAAREAVAWTFALSPADPYAPVKILQAAFDPASLRFSPEWGC